MKRIFPALALSLTCFSTSSLHAAVIATTAAGSWVAGSTWVGGIVPGDGDTANINHGTIDHNVSDGFAEPTDFINLNAGGVLRVQRSHVYENMTLNGGQLHIWNDDDTVTIGTLTVVSGQLRDRNNREDNGIAATTIVGSGNLNFFNWSNSGSVAEAFFIDSPNMTGFTGSLDIGSPGRVGLVDLRQDITPANASFSMTMVAGSNQLVLSGHVAVIALALGGDNLSPGTYTLDTTANPGATDLSNVGGTDYSGFFQDSSGTITVVPEPSVPCTLLGAAGLLVLVRRRNS